MTQTETRMQTAEDVVAFLKGQHELIKKCFKDVFSAHGDERKDAFVALRRLLAVHETAEEEIVHPAAKRALEDGERVVDARLKEENEAKHMLAELEKMDVDAPEFETRLRAFEKDVVSHAEAEEHEEFSKLRAKLEDTQLERMRNAVKVAEALAPTRPHPGVESPMANLTAGPFAMMLDRARDLIAGKTG